MQDSEPPTVFLLHALGGSARSFDLVRARLPDVETIAVDLPGFGRAVAGEGHSVGEMVAHVARVVAARASARWMVIGHSMGGKVATLLARRAVDDPVLAGLAGVVLLAGSPPSPEPMEESRRARMIGWVADGPIGDADARGYVEANSATRLPLPIFAGAAADARRSSRRAWRAWLEHGSRENLCAEAGLLPSPALIIAGGEDGDLGEATQRRLNAPHYVEARMEVIAGAAHLLPLEAPDVVAALIRAWWERCTSNPPLRGEVARSAGGVSPAGR